MVGFMKNVAGMNLELTVEERNLLSVAYKNVIGARRASWRILNSIGHKEEGNNEKDKLLIIEAYRRVVGNFGKCSVIFFFHMQCMPSIKLWDHMWPHKEKTWLERINSIVEFILFHRWQVENELKSICGDILDALDNHLVPSAVLGESKVFYNKM